MPAPGLDEFQRALVLRLAGPAGAGRSPEAALDGELLLRGLDADRVRRYAHMLEHKRIGLVRRALPKSMLLLGQDAGPALHKYVSEARWRVRSEATLLFDAKEFREFLRANGQFLWPKPRYEMVVDGVTLEEACLRLATDPAAAVIARNMASHPTAPTFDWASYVHRDSNTRLLRFRHDVVPLHRAEYTGEPLARRPTYVLVRKLPDQPRVGVHRLSQACRRLP